MTEDGGGLVSRRVLAIGTGLVALYLAILTGQRALEAYRVRQAVEAARQEIAGLRSRNLALQAELSSGPLEEEIERIAREELSLIRPGDHPVILVWPDGEPTAPEANAGPPARAEPGWRGWLRLFFDVDHPVR